MTLCSTEYHMTLYGCHPLFSLVWIDDKIVGHAEANDQCSDSDSYKRGRKRRFRTTTLAAFGVLPSFGVFASLVAGDLAKGVTGPALALFFPEPGACAGHHHFITR